MVTQLRELHHQNIELKVELQSFKVATNSLLRTMNCNVQKLSRAPAIRFNHTATISEPEINEQMDVRTIPLIKCPRTLEILWTEYEFGIGGSKPVKEFTARERGKVKNTYSLRKSFWTLVKNMIRTGYSHTTAIAKIESIYCQGVSESITQVLREIRADCRNGGHPALRYF